MRGPRSRLALALPLALAFATLSAACSLLTGVGDLVVCSGTDCPNELGYDAVAPGDVATPPDARCDGPCNADGPPDTSRSDGPIGADGDAAGDAPGMDVLSDNPTAGCTDSTQCPTGQACDLATGTCSTSCAGGLTCNGGCCDGAQCQPGTSPSTCGANGAACMFCNRCVNGACACQTYTDCSVLQACNANGQCTTSCAGNLKCNFGCCDPTGTCVNGLDNSSACGLGTSICVACGGSTPVCEAGICRP